MVGCVARLLEGFAPLFYFFNETFLSALPAFIAFLMSKDRCLSATKKSNKLGYVTFSRFGDRPVNCRAQARDTGSMPLTIRSSRLSAGWHLNRFTLASLHP